MPNFFSNLTKVNFQQSFKPQEELTLGSFLMFSTGSTCSSVALRINFGAQSSSLSELLFHMMEQKNNGLFYCEHNRILNQIAVKPKVLSLLMITERNWNCLLYVDTLMHTIHIHSFHYDSSSVAPISLSFCICSQPLSCHSLDSCSILFSFTFNVSQGF